MTNEAVEELVHRSAAGDEPCALLASQYFQALLRGERHVASKLVLDAVQAGVSVKDIYLHVFQRSQYEIGRLWQTNQVGVAQEHYCTAATQMIMSQLYPYVFTGNTREGTYVGTCVAGELHEMGGRMIADFFEMAGWDSFFLGASTPAESVVGVLAARKAQILGISAALTSHVQAVEELVLQVRAAPACARVKIIVGGYPFNIAPDLWRKVGADGTAKEPGAGIALAKRLTGKKTN